MKPLGIHMVWVAVNDMNQAKDFFANKLGMTIDSYSPEYNWAEFSTPEGAQLGVGNCGEEGPIKPGQNAVMCITVEDVIATKAELESKNVHCEEIVEVPGHVKMFLIKDDSGNYYHIVQQLN